MGLDDLCWKCIQNCAVCDLAKLHTVVITSCLQSIHRCPYVRVYPDLVAKNVRYQEAEVHRLEFHPIDS